MKISPNCLEHQYTLEIQSNNDFLRFSEQSLNGTFEESIKREDLFHTIDGLKSIVKQVPIYTYIADFGESRNLGLVLWYLESTAVSENLLDFEVF